MRIPFPERISLWYATLFGLSIVVLQLITGTDLLFSLFCFFFIVVSTVAFNVAGGLTRPSGSYIFFFALLAAIVGFITKIILLEPAQSRLLLPVLTIETYVAGMFGMLVAVYLSRRFSLRKGILQNVVSDNDLRLASIGCVVAGVGFSVAANYINSSPNQTIFSPLFRAQNQLNRFLEVAIILGVTYQVRASKGRSSLNLTVLVAWAAIFFQSVFLGYSKEALFSPMVCWLAAAAVLGYNFRPYQVIATSAVFLFFFFYMVPFCQIGRNFRSPEFGFAQNVAVATDLLSRLPEVKRLGEEEAANTIEAAPATYYNRSHGLVDRLQMLSVDDSLHNVTNQLGPIGMAPVKAYVANAVPHVLWKDKPEIPQANVYGHELGLLAPEDETTSISVSPVGEAYRLGGWAGIFILAPVVWFVLFFVMDSLCGDLRRSPWGILVLAGFAHQANEGGLASPIYMITFGVVGILFVAFFTGYILPLIAAVVSPRKRPEFVARAQNRTLPISR